jgi:hypothetical protein
MDLMKHITHIRTGAKTNKNKVARERVFYISCYFGGWFLPSSGSRKEH